MAKKNIILSVCMTCRDGKEISSDDTRGGARLAKKILDDFAHEENLTVRGVD